MHSLTTRAIRLGVVLAVAAAALLTFGAEPAGAAPCGRGCNHNGNQTGGGYSAAAALLSALGGSERSVPQPCYMDPFIEGDPIVQGHYEVTFVNAGTRQLSDPPGVYDLHNIFISCIEDGFEGPSGPGDPHVWENLEAYYAVPALEPDELIALALQALADMAVSSPDIQTSPGDGNPSLVGIETWLMLDEATFTRGSSTDTDGLISVTVWAEPNEDGDVVWDTGEGTKTCPGSGQDGSCTWTYQRSSAGQPNLDDVGRPAYGITASVTYTGGYSVSVAGFTVGGVDNLGDITRTSEPYLLAVDEAQALNTGG
jgi:hypothetical protein